MKDSFERAKKHLNIITIGNVSHGKTTLTDAIASEYTTSDFVSSEKIMKVVIPNNVTRASYETAIRRYSNIDCPEHIDYIKMIANARQLDCAILVVSVLDGPMSQTSEHIRLSRQFGIPHIVVYLNKCDLAKDEEVIDLVEKEVRQLLDKHGYSGDTTKIVRGSALKALNHDDSDGYGIHSIEKLMYALDNDIPDPKVDDILSISVEEIFTNRGIINIVGTVESGFIKVGDSLEIIRLKDKTKTIVSNMVAKVNGLRDIAKSGDIVSLVLNGTKSGDIEKGMVLSTPNNYTIHDQFKAFICILKNEDGSHSPIFTKGYKPSFSFRSRYVAGEIIELFQNDSDERIVEITTPSDSMFATVKLSHNVTMHKGLRFAINEDGKTIGFGIIVKTL